MSTEIVPSSGWQAINVRELWQSRELLYFLVWRDVKVRYKLLGAAWAVLQPSMMMLVFMVFLGIMAKVLSANDPVVVYAGMLPWTFFATAMANAGNSLVNSERLSTKIYFPRLAVGTAENLSRPTGTYRSGYDTPVRLLRPGHYHVSVGSDIPLHSTHFSLDSALGFHIAATDGFPRDGKSGFLHMNFPWRIQRLADG